jgi:hypothetical protein
MGDLRAYVVAGLLMGASPVWAQVQAGTPLTVQLDATAKMKVGEPLTGRLLHPVYTDNRLVLPEGTLVRGRVTALKADDGRRLRGRLRGDFTPFHVPVVSFDELVLPGGETMQFESGRVTDGAPVFVLVTPPPTKGGFLRQEIGSAKTMVKGDVAVLTAPGKAARLRNFVYSQLPYHPEGIDQGTAWTMEVAKGFDGGGEVAENLPLVAVSPSEPTTWMLRANLKQGIDSATTKMGTEVEATVAEPVFNPDHSLAVPQGTKLLGSVTQVRPARRFGRAGVLRFDFKQIVLPGLEPTSVQATMKAVDSNNGQLALDSEGQAKPKPQDKLAVPLLLVVMAARPLDSDGHVGASAGKNALGSNGFGVIGRVVGVAAGSANLAAGIGYYQAMLSIYDRWIARGKEVRFPRDTRIVLETTARRTAAMPTGVR